MSRIRVLVVDDAVVVRRMVTKVLDDDPQIEVVGTAPHGRIALAKIPQLNPDLVTLDVEMPEMDGLETLKALRREHPRLPVIMFSTLTERGAKVTVEALVHGANEYVTKPANVGSVAESIERIREELIPKIHALCGAAPQAPPAPSARAGPAAPAPARRAPAPSRPVVPAALSGPDPRVDAVVIGVSTGGPNALVDLIPALPRDLAVPVLIVQHMPPMFTGLLAERLDHRSPLEVVEAEQGTAIRAGRVVLARGGYHLRLRRTGVLLEAALDQGPHENSCRPAADVLFRSAVEVHREHVLAVVLTGMGYDGRNGCEHVRAAGGRVLVQDQATSVVWGMPGAVAEAGLANAVLPLGGLAREITDRVANGRPARPAPGAGPPPAATIAPPVVEGGRR